MADDPLMAFARRHRLTPAALRDLQTLTGLSLGADSSTADGGDLDDGLFEGRPPAPPPRTDLPPLDFGTDRYAVLGTLGAGGQGAVYRVFDHKMQRPLAMKVLRPLASVDARARFRTETALTVGLEHPGIVPIYDRGVTADGRPWYTMQILDGAHFGRVIRDARLPLRRRVDIFVRACEAVAYAHEQGVIHRDLKPQNVMIGAFGEVRVLDWGLARRLRDRPERVGGPTQPDTDPLLTRAGAVMGTPRYMAPEQIDGDLDALCPATDVYALGLMLTELITGASPGGSTLYEIGALRADDLRPPTAGPAPLRSLCAEATRHDPAARPADAGALAEAVRTWLEGARSRAQAAALVAEARAIEPTIAALRAEADGLDARAAGILDPLPPHAPIEDKRPGWQVADAAVARRREARLAEVKLRQTLQSALRLDPDSAAAKLALTEHYRARLLEAEAAHDADGAAEFEALLLGHDAEANIEWLRGDGKLTLVTDPPGAAVELLRYEARDRRLVEVPLRTIEATPIVEMPLAMGSYLLRITHPGRAPVHYPVSIERHAIWDGIPPGEEMPHAIPLPTLDAIAEGECYVPAGWCTLGGDPDAMDGLPRQRLWVDGFVIARDPVTHGQYIEWLDGLVAAGREAEALQHVPVESSQGQRRSWAYARDPDGRFRLTGAFGGRPEPDWPVVGVSWASAMAFGGSRRTLPASWQWEKAARGVDARAFPWGATFAVNWARVLSHAPGPPSMAAVHAHPADRSPYGVRGMGGNVRDFCRDVYRRRGPPVVEGRPRLGAVPDVGDFLVVKGGSYVSKLNACRAASRFGMPLGEHQATVGFRLCRPLR